MGSKRTGKIRRWKKEGTVQDSYEPSAEEIYSGSLDLLELPTKNVSKIHVNHSIKFLRLKRLVGDLLHIFNNSKR